MSNKKQDNKEIKEEIKKEKEEMSLAEAKAFRQSLAKSKNKELTAEQKREQFRLFWAKEKRKYAKASELEDILWLHLKAANFAEPEKFEEGIKHFGLKKLGK